MNNIKFIRDKASEEARKQFEKIDEIINEKPVIITKETRFLRKFTLAILSHYNNNLGYIKNIDEEKLEISPPKKIELDLVSEVPKKIELNFDLNAPKKIEL